MGQASLGSCRTPELGSGGKKGLEGQKGNRYHAGVVAWLCRAEPPPVPTSVPRNPRTGVLLLELRSGVTMQGLSPVLACPQELYDPLYPLLPAWALWFLLAGEPCVSA